VAAAGVAARSGRDWSAARSGEEACLEQRRDAVGFGERRRRRGMEGFGERRRRRRMERIRGGGVPMWRGNWGRGAVEGLGSGGADADFLARCEGGRCVFFLFSCY
jgi:hypothetical protein